MDTSLSKQPESTGQSAIKPPDQPPPDQPPPDQPPPDQPPPDQPPPDQPPSGAFAQLVVYVIGRLSESYDAKCRQQYVEECVKHMHIVSDAAVDAEDAGDVAPSGVFASRVLCLLHQLAGKVSKHARAQFIDAWAKEMGLDSKTTCTQVIDNSYVVSTFVTCCTQTTDQVKSSFIN